VVGARRGCGALHAHVAGDVGRPQGGDLALAQNRLDLVPALRVVTLSGRGESHEPGRNPVLVPDPTKRARIRRLALEVKDLADRRLAVASERDWFALERVVSVAGERLADDRFHSGEQSHARQPLAPTTHLPWILHVATHGFFLEDKAAIRPNLNGAGLGSTVAGVGENELLRSGLALASANQLKSGISDDGILTAYEVAQLDLVGTQLVVLSACETGLGRVQSGEGVYGLRRALVLAGAEAQVTSLWKVSDDGSLELMVDFYERLLAQHDRSDALRSAQIAMLKRQQRQHPFYWAAFVMSGDPSTLRRAQ